MFMVQWIKDGKQHRKEFSESRTAELFARLHGGEIMELVPGLGWVVA